MDNGQNSPTLFIFRLALTCRKAKKIIEFFIEPKKLTSIAKYHALDAMIDVFYTRPNFTDKVTKPDNDYHSINKVWDNPIFGGSIFDGVHNLNQKEYKLEPRPNHLLENMHKTLTEVTEGEHVHEWKFLNLKNIKLPTDYSKSLAAPERVMDI